MSRTRNRPARVAVAAIGVAAALALTGGPAPAAPAAPAANSAVSGARTVTLPTGDKLAVRTDPAGRLLISPVRTGTPLVTRTLGGDLYAFPVSATLKGARLDPSAFDVSALLRGESTAPPAAHPDFPMRTVTLNVTDDQGQPAADATIAVVDVDDSREYEGFPEAVDGLAKISVPDGNYTAMVIYYDTDADGNLTAVKFAFTDFTVAGGPASASVDVRTASNPVSVTTPKKADLIGQDITWYRGSDDTYGISAGFIGFPASIPFYLGEDQAAEGVQHFYTHDRLETPAGTAKPYAYDVEVPTDGALTGDYAYQVKQSELATLDTAYYGDTARTGYTLLFGTLPWETTEGRGSYPVDIPQRRPEYVTTGYGLTYSGSMQTGSDFLTSEFVSGGTQAYRAGQHVTIDWMRGPIAPGIPADTGTGSYRCQACRSGDTLSVALSPVTDTEPDHSGYLAYGGDGVTSSARFQLYQGSTQLADLTGQTGGDFTVGPDPADYRVVYDQTRILPLSKLSTTSHSEWTFRSAHSGGNTVPDRWLCAGTDCSALSLLTVKTACRRVSTAPSAPARRP